MPNPSQPRLRKKRVVATTILCLLAITIAGVIVRRRTAHGQDETKPTFDVKRGPLTISLSSSGTMSATEQEIIKCEVEGETTVIYIIEEGSLVEEGDLLVELDSSSLQDRLIEQQINVKNAEAAFINAREDLAVKRNQAESDIALAELNTRFAKEDLAQYRDGTYKQDLMSAESKITLAEEELQLAQKTLEWSEKLYKEEYISQAERDSDRLACNRARLDLELVKEAKSVLEKFTYKRQLAQLKSDVTQAEKALERAKLKASANLVQAEAGLSAKESELQQQKTKMEKIRDQLAKTKIKAPRAGLVVYATSTRFRWRGSNEPLEAGQRVRERQELIHLPTADEMKVVVDIQETDLDMIREGLPAVISVDTIKGKTYIGHISKIAPLPNAASMWMNPDLKVYRTEILLDGKQPELRTGVSSTAEIIIDRYEDALYIPVQAVVRLKGQPTVFVKEGPDFVPRPIEVGRDNNRMIHVISGVEKDETVLMTPPLQDTGLSAERQPGDLSADAVKELADRARNTPARSRTPEPQGNNDNKPRRRPANSRRERPPAEASRE